MRALVLAAFLAGAPACFTPTDGSACRTDSDCGDAVCTRVGECSSQPYALRVSWTVQGQAANATGACSQVSELELAIFDPSLGDEYAVRPVPCGVGSFFYDKLPPGYTEVTVTAFGSGGFFLTSARGTALGADGAVTLDLQF